MWKNESKKPERQEVSSKSEIVRWLFEPGQSVNKNEVLAEVQFNETIVEVQSPVGGILEIKSPLGSTIETGNIIALIRNEETSDETTFPIVFEAQKQGVNKVPLENNRKSFDVFDLFFMLVLPLIAVALIETIHRGSFLAFRNWTQSHTGQFIVNYIYLFGVINIFWLFSRKIYLYLNVLLVIPLLTVASYVSYVKMELRGQPVLPWDLTLSKEAENISAYFQDYLSVRAIVISLVVIVIACGIIYLLPKQRRSNIKSVSIAIVSVILFVIALTDKPFAIKGHFGVTPVPWDQREHVIDNGFLMGFMLNMEWLTIDEPVGYSEEKIKSIINQNPMNEMSMKIEQKPNIIFVQSEAFWDPTYISEVGFSEDPIPYFHELQKTQTNGSLVVPTYGGGTSNTEFEVLTGMSMQFLPDGATAYTQYVREPIHSAASVLHEQGYKSTAVHTYHNWFYSRNEVYKNFGFDNFVSVEFFNDPEYRGEFIADKEIANRIVQEVKNSENPDFVYAVTMQNHAPYILGKNKENTIKVDGKLSPESKDTLESYAQSLRDADEALKTLIEGIQALNEPSVIVIYGDHLPALGSDYKVYKEASYVKDITQYEDYKKLYTVPFVIWDNFKTDEKKSDLRMSSNFLTPYVLSHAGLKGNVFFEYLNVLYDSGIKVVPREQFLSNENLHKENLNDYKQVQYDLLFGQEFTFGEEEKPKENKRFILGSGDMTIEKSNVTNIKKGQDFNIVNGQSTITLNGVNFSKNSTVYVNGETVQTEVGGSDILTAYIPNKYYEDAGTLEIELKSFDSLGNKIATSNLIKIPIE